MTGGRPPTPDRASAGEHDSSAGDLVRVTLLEVPVQVWGRTDDEVNDLMREFALIVLNRDRHHSDVPSQLMELIKELQMTYGSLGHEQALRLERARAEEEPVIDRLDYFLPAGSQGDIRRLGDALDAADDYCRQGTLLLSLASSPVAKAFRDWLLEEFVTQLDGGAPTPWPQSPYAGAAREAVAE